MFRAFFLNRKWLPWSFFVTILLIYGIWYSVQLSVEINEWYGKFYDVIQEALEKPNTVEWDEYLSLLIAFTKIALIIIFMSVFLEFIAQHYIFRWRTALHEYYTSHWQTLRHIEGASQRVQEDTMRFARIVENLGVTFINALLTLVAFLPILWDLSKHVVELPVIGYVDHSLVYLALISAASGTVLLAVVGAKLPGLEFNNQKVEAAYRKELVLGEDEAAFADPPTLKELFSDVRKNYFILYRHYLYFNTAKWTYIQGTTLIPYIALGPSVLMGAFTLGVFSQITRAFGQVEKSFQVLVYSWTTIIELMSIYKRLKAFEQSIKGLPLQNENY